MEHFYTLLLGRLPGYFSHSCHTLEIFICSVHSHSPLALFAALLLTLVLSVPAKAASNQPSSECPLCSAAPLV